MKYLVLGLTFAAAAVAQRPNVSECFKVHSMIRADESHYWTTWTNACPYTIDSVYVMVRFADHSARDLADGVWSLHFIKPGAHRTMRFSAPGKLVDFASVRKNKITADMEEAFGRPRSAEGLSALEMAAVSSYREAVAKDRPAPRIVKDDGGDAYRSQIPPAQVPPAQIPVAEMVKAVALQTSAVKDPGEGSFRADFPDPWRAVLTASESAVSPAPHASFVRLVSEDKPRLP